MNTLALEPVRRILAIRLDNLGDVIMTGPALRALKEAFPASHLTLMASPGGSLAAPLLPWVDDVIQWRAVWQDIASSAPVTPEKELELAALLEQRQFDAAFIFTSFSQSPHPPAYALYLARVPLRVGQSKEFGGALLTHWVRPPADQVYQVDRNLHLLREVGISVRSSRLEVRVPSAEQESAGALLQQVGIAPGQPYMVLVPGASAVSRRYPEGQFGEAAARLVTETGLPIVMIGSQREQGRFPTLESLAQREARFISLIGRTSVPEMAALIERAAVLIGNNSGSMHIAAALNRPMVILFAGTELLEQWAPLTRGTRILNRPTHCTPCHAFECRYHLECLDIPPEEIVRSVLDLLNADGFTREPGAAPHTAAYSSLSQIER